MHQRRSPPTLSAGDLDPEKDRVKGRDIVERKQTANTQRPLVRDLVPMDDEAPHAQITRWA